MTQQSLITRLKAVEEALSEFVSYIGPCDHSVGICCCSEIAALSDLRELIEEAEGQEPAGGKWVWLRGASKSWVPLYTALGEKP